MDEEKVLFPEARVREKEISKFTLHDYLKCGAFFNLRPFESLRGGRKRDRILCSHDSHEHKDVSPLHTRNGRDTIFIAVRFSDEHYV